MKFPRWIAIVILCAMFLSACGGGGGSTNPGQATSAPVTAPTSPAVAPTTASAGGSGDQAALGKTVYAANCAGCHGENGQGSGSFPALAGNAAATGDPAPQIQFVLNGKDGSHKFGDKLTDQEIAAVLTYIRTNWGNQAGQISEEQVKSAR